MKVFVLASALFIGAYVHADRIVEFSCDGTPHGYNVTVSGTLSVYGHVPHAQYKVIGPLTVSGDDMLGNGTLSDGSDNNGSRFFNEDQVQAYPEGSLLMITAQSPSGSHVRIFHIEGSKDDNRVEIDLMPTHQPQRERYTHTFSAQCGFTSL